MTKVFTLLSLLFLAGCYYDNEQDLYPNPPGGGCDTVAVSFNTEIWPIINTKCTSCHSGSFPSGSLALTNHAQVTASLPNIIDRIERNPDDPLLMPQGAKLDACSISKIKAWAAQGAVNN